ncbi:hypothetical protein NFI96_001830 [Prochilodus magdalenae]|nr:hypothetical protein NFI96_001830 [Prochilodus magdalenae]
MNPGVAFRDLQASLTLAMGGVHKSPIRQTLNKDAEYGMRRLRGSHFPQDALPGPHPQTPEERAAAAKKYNLMLEDYQPYPDDGKGFGDYPMLPNRSQQERDPWYKWDHPDLRRNWGEPIHWDFDMFIRNRVDTSPSPVDWSTMSKTLLGFLGFMLLMFGLGEVFPSYQPVDLV